MIEIVELVIAGAVIFGLFTLIVVKLCDDESVRFHDACNPEARKAH